MAQLMLRRRQCCGNGHIAQKNGYFYIILNLYEMNGKRKQKWISTGLPIKGNKKRAEQMLSQAKVEYKQQKMEEEAKSAESGGKILFSDFLRQWLKVKRSEIKKTTFGGYQMNVERIIAPYFRKKGIYLQDLKPSEINDFYAEQLTRVKATSVHKYHANIVNAIKYAVELELLPYFPLDRIHRPKKEQFTGLFLRQSEVIELFNKARGHKLELAVILGAFYGLRRGERWCQDRTKNFHKKLICQI